MKPRLMQIETAYRSDQEQKLDAYATLLLDVIEGDRSLFIRFDEVEVAWRVVGPVLEHWRQTTDDLHAYPAGSWGPLETQRLFDKPYQFWRNQV